MPQGKAPSERPERPQDTSSSKTSLSCYGKSTRAEIKGAQTQQARQRQPPGQAAKRLARRAAKGTWAALCAQISVSEAMFCCAATPNLPFCFLFYAQALLAFGVFTCTVPLASSISRMISPTAGTVMRPASGFLMLSTGVVMVASTRCARRQGHSQSFHSSQVSAPCSNTEAVCR